MPRTFNRSEAGLEYEEDSKVLRHDDVPFCPGNQSDALEAALLAAPLVLWYDNASDVLLD